MVRQRKISLTGSYRLPSALVITPKSFGKTVNIEIGGYSGKILLPEIIPDVEHPRIVAPSATNTPEIIRHIEHYMKDDERHDWGAVTAWNGRTGAVAKAYVTSVQVSFLIDQGAVTYSEYLYGRGHPVGGVINDIFGSLDAWYEALRTWLEIGADQDLDPNDALRTITMPGSGLQLLTVDDGTISLPASASNITISMSSEQSISLPLLRRAARLVSEGRVPSDAHLLLRDAKASMRRKRFRRAAIDSGSAAEITLAAYNVQTTKVNTPAKGATLGWYVKQPLIASSAGIPSNFDNDVVQLRNRAIHRNITPTLDETRTSIRESFALVGRLDPLPL